MSYTPGYGGFDVTFGQEQFSGSMLISLSYRVTPIEFVGHDGAHASGFFWRANGRDYLITNWHVVTGNDVFTNSCLFKTKVFAPSRIRIYATDWTEAPQHVGYFAPARRPIEVSLFDEAGCPRWLQHTEAQSLKIDVVAIPLPTRVLQDRSGQNPCLNGFQFEKLLNIVGDDVFCIGYPFKTYYGAMAAIWKRGSIATDPIICVDKKPMVLLDVLGTKGMSGSPVIRRVTGITPLADLSMQLQNIVSYEFIGVYSGRLESSEMERVGLGYAWHGRLVDEIVQSGVAGTTTL